MSRDHLSSKPEVRAALGELERFSGKLSVPDTVTDEAALICAKALKMGLAKGRTVAHVAASSIYAACREKQVPATLGDVAAVSTVDRDDVAKCYRLLVLELDLKIPVADPAEYVSTVASRAKVSPQVEADALEILAKASKAGVTAGACPAGLTASVLYLASMLDGEKLTQSRAAMAAGVAESTVRKESKRLRRALGV